MNNEQELKKEILDFKGDCDDAYNLVHKWIEKLKNQAQKLLDKEQI